MASLTIVTSLKTFTLTENINKIYHKAFYCTGLISITIPNSIKEIGSEVFSGSSLTSVVIGCSNLSIIDKSVFSKCSLLTSYIFTGEMNKFKASFIDIKSLRSITFNGKINEIPSSTFREYVNLENVTLLNEIGRVNEMAFYKCPNLTYVTLSSSSTTYNNYAFAYCKSIKSLVFQAPFNSIGKEIFKESFIDSVIFSIDSLHFDDNLFKNTNIRSIRFKKSVDEIPEKAFYNMSLLTEVTFMDSVKNLKENAFAYCKNLKKLQYCTKIQSITIQGISTTIENSAFAYCSGLKSIIIKSSDAIIKVSAFYQCENLELVELLSDTVSIGKKFIFKKQIKRNYIQ